MPVRRLPCSPPSVPDAGDGGSDGGAPDGGLPDGGPADGGPGDDSRTGAGSISRVSTTARTGSWSVQVQWVSTEPENFYGVARHKRNVSAAAREARLSRSQFYRLLERHKLALGEDGGEPPGEE